MALTLRSASPDDVPSMVSLMTPFIEKGDLLPKTPVDLMRELQSYVVAVTSEGRVVGSGSLRRFTPALAEVQALAVAADYQGTGVGRRIVEAIILEAERQGFKEIFALTRRPEFFVRLDFHRVDKERFPDKIWADCARCPRQHACDELAVHRELRTARD